MRNNKDPLSWSIVGRRAAWIAFLLVLLAVGAILIAGHLHSHGGLKYFRSAPGQKIIFATNTEYVGTCPVLLAKEQGYFADEGIAVSIQSYTSGKAAMDAILSGRANLGTVADIPVMFAGINKQPVAVIATIFNGEKDHGIVGRRDLGVTAPASLKGKRIGVTLSTSGHFALNAFLNHQRLSPDDVVLRNFQPEMLATALANGDVDAVATWEPFLDQIAARLGSNAIVFYGQDVYESLYNVAGMRNYIVSHPDAMQGVLRALERGVTFCSANQEVAQEYFVKTSKADPAKLKAAWPDFKFDLVLDQGLILALEDEARWAIKNKLTNDATMPNYLDYIYLDDLEAVKPAAVTIIH